MKLLDILKEEDGENSQTRSDICIALLFKAQQSLNDALRNIENAYQHCDDKEWQEQLLSFKKSLIDDYGVGDGNGSGIGDEDKPDNLINKIAYFIQDHSINDWDASEDNTTEEKHTERFNTKV